jgi:hypothetical protein
MSTKCWFSKYKNWSIYAHKNPLANSTSYANVISYSTELNEAFMNKTCHKSHSGINMWDKGLNYTPVPTGRLSKPQILASEFKNI